MATTTKKPKAPTLTQRVDALDKELRFEATSDRGYNKRLYALERETQHTLQRLYGLENPPGPKRYRVEVEPARLGRGWCAWIYRPGSSSHVTHTSSGTPERARRKAERWIKKDIKQQAKPADPNVGTFYVDAGSQ